MAYYLIAHRGLTDGPNESLENHPENILQSIDSGYDCEIDLRVLDGRFFLGHNSPDHEVKEEFLENPHLWIHCKNIESVSYFFGTTGFNYFWHQEDDLAVTSRGYLWIYPGKPLGPHSIWVQPEWDTDWRSCFEARAQDSVGVCSKYVAEIRSIVHQ